MADPVQIRAKEQRLAEALRANLKRRKQQARDRSAADSSNVDDTEGEAAVERPARSPEDK